MKTKVVFLYLCSAIAICKSPGCPISTSPNFTSHRDHLYPIDIYHTNYLKDGIPMVPFERCRVVGIDEETNFSCPIKSLGCPLIEANIDTGLSISSEWKKTTSMCTIHSALRKSKETVNVIAFGGSVTIGRDSTYCCPLAECNIVEGPRCAWPHYIEPWLRFIGKASVNVYNFGKGGTNSYMSGERMQEYFDQVRLTKLSKNDIIFIDHSFNDNTMVSLSAKSQLERGLEKLIRRLLSYTENEVPTIILIESDTQGGSDRYYPRVYRNLAQHYGLRIYSFMEATRTNQSITQQKAYHHHLTHKHRGGRHPVWHTHLVYADFLSALLLREMSECNTTYKQDGSTPFSLPASIHSVKDHEFCDRQYPPLLRMSYDDIKLGTQIGDYSMPSNGTWQLRIDRKGRGGFIAELNETNLFTLVHKSPLWLTLNITVSEIKKLYHRREVMLQVNYERSYFNAGKAVLMVCGEEVFGAMDALWNDWRTYHYTLSEMFTLKIESCELPDHEKVVLGILHWIDDADGDINDMQSIVHSAPRSRQYFKINSILVCRYSQ